MQPTLVVDSTPEMRIVKDELFGPGVAMCRASSVDNAIRMAGDSNFGLSAGVFTQDIDAAIRFAREVQSGNIHINGGPMWRTDSMPYGGLKDSGLGKEGPKYAIDEMTEMKSVVIHS
jgi:acyl-CoA reductase-like NAD-dependent aldehyde dehydrogenase